MCRQLVSVLYLINLQCTLWERLNVTDSITRTPPGQVGVEIAFQHTSTHNLNAQIVFLNAHFNTNRCFKCIYDNKITINIIITIIALILPTSPSLCVELAADHISVSIARTQICESYTKYDTQCHRF